jgi:hypothetical protein
MKLNFRVNDTMHEISVDPRLTLLERDLLRVVLDRGLVYRWIDADVSLHQIASAPTIIRSPQVSHPRAAAGG